MDCSIWYGTAGMMISETTISTREQRDEILHRAFSGAKWMLYLSASALVAGFCTNVILGRMGAEVLGFYSLLMLIVSMVQTFFVFGASNVFVNYLPNLKSNERSGFIFTYTILVYFVGTAFLAVCLFFPSVMQVVFRQELHIPIGMYIGVLVPILLAQVLVWSILQAELDVTILAVSQNAVSWFYLINIGLMAALGIISSADGNGPSVYLFVAVVLANLVALGIGIFFVKREYFRIADSARRWFLPPGFWKFTLSIHFGTLFNFVIANAAPVFILRELGLRELGYFRASAVFAGFVSWIPSVFDKSFYPSFCNLVSRKLPTDEAYARFSRLNAMSAGLVALVIILFTKELLSVFGKEFTDGAYFLLIMLSAGYLITIPFIQINFALVTAHLKTPYTMIVYALGAIAGIALYGTLVPGFGLTGIAIAFMLLQLIMFALSMILMWYFTRSPFPFRAYLITLSAMSVGLVGAYYFGSLSFANTGIKIGLFGLFLGMLFVTKLVTRDEAKELLNVILPKSGSRR